VGGAYNMDGKEERQKFGWINLRRITIKLNLRKQVTKTRHGLGYDLDDGVQLPVGEIDFFFFFFLLPRPDQHWNLLSL
jgi:hypothetical protein